MPLLTVSTPGPWALRTIMFVGPPRTCVVSTTNVSERVATSPWLSTVSSFSVPPSEMKVPGPGPAMRGVDRQASLACAGDHEHVASDRVALQIDRARVGERRHPDQVTLHRPVESHRVVE